ncbi:MAG: sigma-54-dependent Fis family transcriptional regulator [Polyangiaceae bacterium]|nr:sigma-54-dependent Fis family transcriptional regulator [Polyangiaceae bacterium]MCE7889362.1 sigma-54-dependent Fis family transcriptional regulator [Sorangiineae bacterium PRO1]MCL4752693.1 sigma-54 dependent transcriptional regulator [Myxococcales bacterium]
MKVLVVDDQEPVRIALSLLFELHGLGVIAVASAADALRAVREADVGVVVQDMNFSLNTTSGDEGIALFREIHALDADLPVVLMTAWTSLETAVKLVKEGAADYVAKPWDDTKLVVTVQNLLRLRAARQENTRLRHQADRQRTALSQRYDLCGLVYQSAGMQTAVSLATQVARADVPVLITGPNGSGKEKLAEIVHANSSRRGQPLLKVNVGALPDTLLEAELFGAEAGAYTGAQKARTGVFEAAHGGTLFLDEIGTLSLAGQAKLLRVLQNGELQRLGSSTTRKVDVRVISATNTDMVRAIAAGSFREDLYFRLNVIEVRVPPLCERSEDIRLLAEHFVRLHHDAKDGRPLPVLSEDALAALEAHDFPGNVRELENRVKRALLVRSSDLLRAVDLDLGGGRSSETPAPPSAERDPLSEAERQVIETALVAARGVVSKAAAELGLSRQALYRRMERLGIELERKPRA